jgi:hypothetical protein
MHCCQITYIISGQSLCTAMSECNELNTEDCPECLSGQRECDKQDNQCWINGLCQGRLIKEVKSFLPQIIYFHF